MLRSRVASLDARDVLDRLISAHRDVALCEQALEVARGRMESAAADLQNAQQQVERCQEDITRMARGQSAAPAKDESDVQRRGDSFVPYRR